ncbi:hypothetical protein CesoFtcFv8_009559 [Champsocephalus esox]|uniref:Uncharacterized protein n=1 Tax=Champsocephalus esox TaxID=159716 RepID=A0AAN8H2K7_9TELE|nr:hypothetical protein CesoFtcFv8_009559 [Champsocephalus esox]
MGGLSIMDNSLFSVLLSTTASKGSSLMPMTDPAFLILLVSPALMLPPPSKEECTGHNRLEDLQHLAAHVEGSQLPQKIESAHPLLVLSVSVDPPVQPISALPGTVVSTTATSSPRMRLLCQTAADRTVCGWGDGGLL